METTKILQSDYLDLIFDNRNKKYGGYELRKHYNRRALKSLGITLSVIMLGVGTPFLIGKLQAKERTVLSSRTGEVVATIRDIEIPKPPEAPKPPATPQPPAPPPIANTIKNLPPVIMDNDQVKPDEKPPEAKDLIEKVSGPVTNPGQKGSEIAMTTEKPSGPTGTGDRPGVAKTGGPGINNDQPLTFADEMPEFPGGMKALMAFLQHNLVYPAVAREDGIEGRVVLRFIVNAEGRIEGATVERSIGGGCDKEALRVVNAMPKWRPGKQKGHNVKVYYTLPISFKLNS